MKNIAKYLFAISAAAFTFAACEKETEVKPGEPELDGCYGVYFPVQDASGDHVFNPTQDPKIEITVARTNTEGAITVPVTASYSEEDIFTMTDIVFADGQAETTFTLSFDKAAEGVNYAAHFVIEDNKYASIYSSNATGLDFSVLRVAMKEFQTEDGSKTANLTFTDDSFWGEIHDEITIEYYEVDGIRYCTTKGGKLLAPDNGTVGLGPWGTNVQLSFKWYVNKTVTIDDAEYQWIEVAPNYIGYDSSNGPVYMGDFYWMRADMGLSNGDYASSYDRYTKGSDGYLPSYYDGHGGFIFNAAYWIHGTTSWYGYKDNTPVAIAEGYVRVDYSLSLETDYSDEGQTPVYVEAGVDVKSIKYDVVAGKLSGIQTENKIAELIADDSKMTAVDLLADEEAGVNYATLLLSPEESGDYTVIVFGYDEAGKLQATGAVAIHHINATDAVEKKVVVSAYTEDTPARYQNLHSYDSFAYGIIGENLTEVHVGIFTKGTVDQYGSQVVLDAVKYDEDGDFTASEEDLAAINADGGFYDILKGLAANTTYYIIVWATNGDLDGFALSAYTTDKLPYVWNSLGTGTITDGFFTYLFGKDDFTVACDFYQEATDPGLYMITGFQQELSGAFFGVTKEDMAPYEGGNWVNAEVVIDAHDPNAVFIEEQDYGVLVNSNYGWIKIETEASGTLADGVLTWPTKEMYVYLGGWYYGNGGGNFKLVFPEAVAAAPKPSVARTNGHVEDATLAGAVKFNRSKVVYERDPQSIQVKAEVVYMHKEHKTPERVLTTVK